MTVEIGSGYLPQSVLESRAALAAPSHILGKSLSLFSATLAELSKVKMIGSLEAVV